MSSLVPHNFGAVSTRFADKAVEDDLSSGIQSSFGIVGYKGKVWSIRYRGEEQQLMRADGDGPRSSIEVVILKASKHISKVWYEQGYVEGSNAAPDCFSNNGVVPEPTSLKKQCDSCALCPHNQWGSRVTPAGKQGKSCADSKRIAVVPMEDLANEVYGGPMLLRVPAASLQDLAMYGQKMQQMGYPYYSIATRIQFDAQESYPKFKISAFRPLSDEEADEVIAMRDGHSVERILSENEFAAPPAGPTADAPLFDQDAENDAGATDTAADDAAKAAMKAKIDAAAAAKAEEAKKAIAAKKAADAKKALAAKKAAEIAALEAELAEGPIIDGEVESDEDREARELEAKLAALKAKKAQQAAGTAEVAKTPVQKAEPVQQVSEALDADDSGNMASDFEANLDSMLADLLPE